MISSLIPKINILINYFLSDIKIIAISSIFFSLIITSITHPVIIVVIIRIQSLTISIAIAYSSSSAWFSLILFLVFIGGLIVLFVYISSLASNETFTQKNYFLNLNLIFLFISALIILIFKEEIFIDKRIKINTKELIIKIYSNNNFEITFIIILYLLIVLIVAVTIISIYEGPLRRVTNYDKNS